MSTDFSNLYVPIAPVVGVAKRAPVGVSPAVIVDDGKNDPVNTIAPAIVQPVFGPVDPTESLKKLKEENGGKLYFPAPPAIISRHKYPSVNNDPKLQNMVTKEFHEMLKVWLKKDDEFKPLLKIKKELMSKDDGHEIVLRLLKLYVRRNNTFFYDLEYQVYQVKQFMLYKLKQLV